MFDIFFFLYMALYNSFIEIWIIYDVCWSAIFFFCKYEKLNHGNGQMLVEGRRWFSINELCINVVLQCLLQEFKSDSFGF